VNPEDSRYGDDPIFAIFRFLDLDFIFQVVLSLFAILFAYDAINGEKERGTLQLTFANALSRSTYIAGKLIGSFAALALPLLIPFFLGVLILLVMKIPMGSSDWMRLALVMGAGYAYLAAVLTMTLCLSTWSRHSSTSFLFALVAWVFSVMIVPRTAVLAAGRAVDVPSVDEILSQKSRYSASLWQESRRRLAEYTSPEGSDVQKAMLAFEKFMADESAQRDAKMEEFTSRVDEQRRNKEILREQWALGFARLSPGAVYALLSEEIAGTGLQMKESFKESTLAYQKTYGGFLYGKTGATSGGGMIRIKIGGDQEKKTPINPYELPQFIYRAPQLGAAVGEMTMDFGILFLWITVSFALAHRAFLRYDLR